MSTLSRWHLGQVVRFQRRDSKGRWLKADEDYGRVVEVHRGGPVVLWLDADANVDQFSETGYSDFFRARVIPTGRTMMGDVA